MQIGLIGLGRMGSNIVRRLMRRGHQCVLYDRNPSAMTALVEEGATRSDDLRGLVGKLTAPRS
ncbi:MAG TPA: NAD(P)-binding domain-containing protein, partial [Rhizomicrobium sp.]|nr:NAD(P)-binding domain-containing protein [Rhizomicrobium sp.]